MISTHNNSIVPRCGLSPGWIFSLSKIPSTYHCFKAGKY